ncbi:GGDEF domain-containing response regulator [Spirulina subsalsa]|uniref:two-component system response regulator n=1 Tax=Spirulina subsalsa TaxID=54311 RepID=UPI000304F6AC|nr:GGDEF domain-containing response regulator [Spirulina subsalsa]
MISSLIRAFPSQVTSSISTSQRDILIVDDTPENLRLLSQMLMQHGYNVRKARNGKMALMAVQTMLPDIILLDIMMPNMDGYEVCQQLKSDPKTAQIPVVFLSALDEVMDKVNAFKVGGADYITKPFQIEEVLTRVEHQLSLKQAEAEIRELNSRLEERVKERTQQLQAVVHELELEIQQRKQAEHQLLEMALHDALTGLPNRVLLAQRLQNTITRASLDPDYHFAVLFLDCDRFKVINDSLGHRVGDQLLVALASRIQAHLQSEDTLARLGGDEFAIILGNSPDLNHATQVAQNILESLEHPFQLEECEVFTNVSIGIVFGDSYRTLHERNADQPEHLLRDADNAMYRAKEGGRGTYHVFDPTMHQIALERLNLETELRYALNRNEFLLHYQPIVHLKSGKIQGFEALIRWHSPTRGLVSPSQFIPITEETGLIVPLGQWVLKEACSQLRQWQKLGLVNDSMSISVNLTAHQFTQVDFCQQLDQILAETGLSPHHLKLEITESTIMDNQRSAQSILQQLKSRHISLSIDDFGTGYSSLSYLHAFPVDILKVDRSFVQSLDGSREKLGLIPAIFSITQAMGMSAIAEGIETAIQLDQLRHLNYEFGQGYFFSKPLPSEAVVELLKQDPQW